MTASDVLTLRSSEQLTAVLAEDLFASTKRVVVRFGLVRGRTIEVNINKIRVFK
jgi:hypothetical protein